MALLNNCSLCSNQKATLRTTSLPTIPAAFSAVTTTSPACFRLAFSILNTYTSSNDLIVIFSSVSRSSFPFKDHFTVGAGLPDISTRNSAVSFSLMDTEFGPIEIKLRYKFKKRQIYFCLHNYEVRGFQA